MEKQVRVRFNITMDSQRLAQLDEVARVNSLTRSGCIEFIVHRWMLELYQYATTDPKVLSNDELKQGIKRLQAEAAGRELRATIKLVNWRQSVD